jgi:hypothetical protein
MSVEKLIAELAAGADLSEPKHFTLDREKAREKLRDHQLSNPRLYVLELIQAAVIRGATTIRFNVDSNDVRMWFDGDLFDARDLDELYDAIWSSGRSDIVRARKCLALGFTSVMALKPRFVRLVSSDGERGTSLELRPDAPDRIEPRRLDPAGTTIHIKSRSRPQAVADFFHDITSDTPEETLIRDHCRFSETTVELEGEVVSGGVALPEATLTVDITGPGVSGLGGLYPHKARPPFYRQAGGEDRRGYSSRLILLRDGVWITTHPLDLDPGCFVAVVNAPALRKDASQHDFVQDDVYREVLQAVQQAHLAAVAELSRARREGELQDVDEAWIDASLHRFLARHFDRQAYERRDPIMRELALVPVLHSVAGKPLSLQQIIDWWREDGAVLYGSDAFPLLAAGAEKEELERVVQLKKRADEAICEKAFAGALRDADRAFEQRKQRAEQRDRDPDHRPPPRLAPGNYLARSELAPDNGPPGEVGLLSGPSPESRISLVRQGRTLDQVAPTHLLPGLVAVLEAPVRMDGETGHIRRDRRLGQALLAVYDALPATCAMLARRQLGEYGSELQARDHRRELLIQFLGLWLDPQGCRKFLEACSLPSHIAKAVTEHRPAVAPPPDGLATLPPEVTGLPLLLTVGGKHRSLNELAVRVAEATTLSMVRVAPPADAAPTTQPETFTEAIVAPPHVRAVLELCFGPDRLTDITAKLRHHAYRAAFDHRPQRPLAVGGLFGIKVTAPDFEAVLGIRPAESGSTAATTSQLTVLLQGRPLATDPLGLPLPSFEALVNGDQLTTDEQYSGLADFRQLAPIRRALFRATAVLLDQLLDPTLEHLAPESARHLARRAIVGLFGAPAIRRTYRQLRREDPASANQRLMDLLDVGVAWPLEELSKGLSDLVEEGQPCTTLALTGRLPSLPVDPECGPIALEWDISSTQIAPSIDWADLTGLQAAPALVERLTSFPGLIAGLGERWLTLTEVLAARRDHGRLLAVERHSTARQVPDREPVLALDDLDRQVIASVVGPDAFTDAEPLLNRMATRVSFLAQPEMDRMGLRSSEVVSLLGVDEPNTQGEIGLTRNHYGEPEAELRLFLEHRQVAVRRGFVPFGLVAVLNDDRLTPDKAYDDVENDAVLAQLMVRCEAAIDPLFEQLADAWPGLGSGDREVAWRHILDYLVVHHRAQKKNKNNAAASEGLQRRLEGLDGFRAMGGRRHTWREVNDSVLKRGCMEYLSYDVGSASTDLGRPILVASDLEVRQLKQVYDRVVDFSDAWYEEQEATSRRQAASPLPRVPSRPLANQRLSVDQGGLDIDLWLDPLSTDPTAERVAFGQQGRVVMKRGLSPRYPCLGTINGPALEVNRGWTQATLRAEHTLVAEELAVRLYRQLLHRYEHEPDGLGNDLSPIRQRLWLLCVRLYRHRSELRLTERHLLWGLAQQDLALLQSGERLSLQGVLDSRPAELTPLGLWAAEAEATPTPAPGSGLDESPEEAALLESIRGLVQHLEGEATDWEDRLLGLRIGEPGQPPTADTPNPLASQEGPDLVLHRNHPVLTWALARHELDPVAPALVILSALPNLATLLQADEFALLTALVRFGLALVDPLPETPAIEEAPSDETTP